MIGALDTVDDIIQRPPPAFGHDALNYFMFDPEYTNVNHGAYGSLPLPVLASCTELTSMVESNPDVFTRLKSTPMLEGVRDRLASLVGAPLDELVIVRNASLGINTVLRNIEWTSSDVITFFSTAYNSIEKTAQYLHDRPPHPQLERFEVRFPCSNATIIQNFKLHLQGLRERVGDGPKIVALLDSIISVPGLYLPWKELVKVSKEFNVLTVIDGAHSVGQELNLNLAEADPDFFVSNCHKWLFAKRSCAFIFVPKRNQHYIKSTIPTPFSYLSPDEREKDPANFVEQFDYNGTVDMVPYLSVIPALKFREWLGGEVKINEYCHDLAIRGGRRLAEQLGTELLDPNGEQTLNMVNVGIPLPSSLELTTELDMVLKRKFLLERNIFAPLYVHNGKWWCRVSTQVWVELEDFDKLASAIKDVCAEVLKEYGHS